MFKRFKERADEDWVRGSFNLQPRRWDLDEVLVTVGCVLMVIYFVLLLVEGAIQ